jgi:hypothetical protein
MQQVLWIEKIDGAAGTVWPLRCAYMALHFVAGQSDPATCFCAFLHANGAGTEAMPGNRRQRERNHRPRFARHGTIRSSEAEPHSNPNHWAVALDCFVSVATPVLNEIYGNSSAAKPL